MLKMYPDLVSAAGFELAVEQCNVSESFDNRVMCYGMPALTAIGKYGENLAVPDASPDMTGNGTLILFKITPD